jgi:hypothetical protein
MEVMAGVLHHTVPGRRSPAWSSGRLVASILIAFAALLTGCTSFRVTTDYDRNMDFSGWTTYAWLPAWPEQGDDPRIHNDLLDARVRSAVDLAMAALGFEKVPEANADFLVAYHVSLETRIDVHTVHDSSHYSRRGWSGSAGTTTRVSQYERGTLLLDVVHPEERRLVWRGSTNARVRERADPLEREKRVNEAAQSILNRFPPR